MHRDLKTDLSLCLLLLGLGAITASAIAQTPGTFTATSNMTAARAGHTATLLPNGKVLIAGGTGLPSAELYDPVTGLFTPTGNMTTPRLGHTASLLPDGRVLIIGGTLTGASAEIYDPATSVFTAAGHTDSLLSVVASALLHNGKALVLGYGVAQPAPHINPVTAELYDPSTGTFTDTGAMSIVHDGTPMATVLPNGNVLISDGGFGLTCCFGYLGSRFLVSCCASELYDAAAGTFSPTSDTMLAATAARTATLLTSGNVLLAGGYCDGCGAFSKAVLYDFASGNFSVTPGLIEARSGHTASLLPDGTVLIAGGTGLEYASKATTEIYDPRSGAFTVGANMTSRRNSHTATLLQDGRVLITGGYDDSGLPEFSLPTLNTAEVYSGSAALPYSGAALSARGGSGLVNLTFPARSSWTASSTADWISFTGPVSGTGNGTLNYQVAANAGASRSTTITVGGLSFTVEQQAASIPGLTLIGSMPHVVAEEDWSTTFTLVNKGPAPAVARLSLFGDPGEALTLPLGFPQVMPAPLPILASSFDRTLAANSLLTIDTAGPQIPPVVQGSAQLAAAGPIDGFATFHNLLSSQEAVVPLETRNASSYLLAFDNTSGAGLGVAVENISAQGASIPVVIRDDNGVQIGLPGAAMALLGSGHTSFELASQYPITANKRGTIEFDTPPGGRISVLGIRTTPLPVGSALTTIPPVTDAGTNGGSFAHIAIGNGWQTTFVLVNTGLGIAQAHLSFFDDSGNALPVPLSFPQLGGNSSIVVPSVDRTLMPGASLIVETATPPVLTMGSAQLAAEGSSVGGFVIFRYNPDGQEAGVPLENRNAGAYLLAFDNTDGNATGVAVSSLSTQAVNVSAVVRDETGAQIASGLIPLAANGHSAFTLAVDKFPETARIRGTIELDAPPGTQISVLGIRVRPAHTFTTLPALTK